MARPRAKPPAHRYHNCDQSIVKVVGKDVYLDKYNRPESTASYAVLISLYQQDDFRLESKEGITPRWNCSVRGREHQELPATVECSPNISLALDVK